MISISELKEFGSKSKIWNIFTYISKQRNHICICSKIMMFVYENGPYIYMFTIIPIISDGNSM